MSSPGRRRFVRTLSAGGVVGLGVGVSGVAIAQAAPDRALPPEHKPLGDALRALNEAALLGIAPEDLAAAESYATGAIREAAAKLRPVAIDDAVEPPLSFAPRRSA